MSLKTRVLAVTPFLPPPIRRIAIPDQNAWTRADDREVARPGDEDVRLLIGGLNTAGQARLWADAAASLPGVSATSLGAVRQKPVKFRADAAPSFSAMRHSPTWAKRQSRELLGAISKGAGSKGAGFTHVLIESGVPIMGRTFGRDLEREIEELQAAGVQVGLIWHGSDIRDPYRHREIHADSPFHGELDGLTRKLETTTARNAALADRVGLPEFVSTPDLLDYRTNATWLPTMYDSALWNPNWVQDSGPVLDQEAAARSRRPIVVHIPSRAAFKGTESISAAMHGLGDIIDYRELKGLTPEQVVQQVAVADIVIDQIGMGLYGVASLEAMALGKPVVAELGTAVRERIPVGVPIVEASSQTIAKTVQRLASDPKYRIDLGQKGCEYVQNIHSQRSVADVLGKHFLTVGLS